MNYNEASEKLAPAWDAWVDAETAVREARERYRLSASAAGVRLCQHCCKPMPDHDHSMQCDGCHLPWGWNTPQGMRDLRAAELDAQIERLRAERAKL